MSECGLLANEDAGALLSHDRIDAPPQSRNGLIDILKFDTHLYSAYISVTSSCAHFSSMGMLSAALLYENDVLRRFVWETYAA